MVEQLARLIKALKRHFLYLLARLPELEHKPRRSFACTSPTCGGDGAQLVEIVGMVRFDLKKPPFDQRVDRLGTGTHAARRAGHLRSSRDAVGDHQRGTDLDIVAEHVGVGSARPPRLRIEATMPGASSQPPDWPRGSSSSSPAAPRGGPTATRRTSNTCAVLAGSSSTTPPTSRGADRDARRSSRRGAPGVLEGVFERFFCRCDRRRRCARRARGVTAASSQPAATHQGRRASTSLAGRQIARATAGGCESLLRNLARLAIAAFGRRPTGPA